MQVNVNTAELDRLLAKGGSLGVAATAKLHARLSQIALHVERRAMPRTPLSKGTLRGSSHSDVRVLGGLGAVATVQFGGMAAAYAEVQHERADFRHTLPSGMSRTKTLRGKQRKHPLTGYRGGQAHWLWGVPSSAWNAGEERLAETLIGRDVERAIGEHLGA